MILRSLKLKNVKCFEDSEVSFGPGKNVIIGRNGSGKSTILQSILYSLYGYYPPGKNEELVRIGENRAGFELEIEHAGQTYIVERKLPVSGSVEAYLYTSRDSDPIAEKQTVVTEEITNKLGLRREIFSDVILVGQGEIAQIIGMTEGNRKELFDKLLGLHDYAVAWTRCSGIEKLLRNEVETSIEVIKAYRTTASELEERKKDLQEKRKEKKQKSDKLRSVKKNLKEEDVALTHLDGLRDSISRLETRTNQRQETIDEEETKASGYREDVRAISADIGFTVPHKLDESTVTSLLEDAEEKHTLLKEELGSTRDEFDENSRRRERLETLRSSKTKYESDLQKQEKAVRTKREDSLSVLPELEETDTEKWATVLIERRGNLETRKEALESELSQASGLESSLKSKEEERDGTLKSVDRLEESLTSIDDKATSGISEGWRELAATDLRGISAKIRALERSEKNENSKLEGFRDKRGRKKNLLDRYREDMYDLTELEGKKCPKCKQIVDETHAKEMREEIEEKSRRAEEELEKLEEKINDIESDLEETIEQKKELEERRQQIEQARIYLDHEKTTQQNLDDEKERLGNAEREIKKTRIELGGYDTEALRENLSDIKSQIRKLDEVRSAAEELPALESNLDEKRSDYEDLVEEIQELEQTSPQHIVDSLSEKIARLEDREEKTRTIHDDLRNLEETLTRLSNWMNEQNQEFEKLSEMKDEYDDARHNKLKEEVKNLEQESAKLAQRIESLQDEIIPTAEQAYNDSKNAAETIEQVSEKEARATESLKVLSKVREFFREVQKPLRRRDTKRASKHATEIFKALIGSNEYDRIQIGENHDLMISRFGLLEPMSTLSGGEQVLAGLAVRLGFARALATSDLLLLDEPTAYLDERRKAELVETLHRTSPANQMLIVTHDDEFQKVAERVIYVEKDESSLTSGIS